MNEVRINLDDMPTANELKDTIDRLRKDFELLSKVSGKNNKENPIAFSQVAGFLEMLLNRESKRLKKGFSNVNGCNSNRPRRNISKQ